MNRMSRAGDPIHIPLDFDTALSGLLKVNPAAMPDKPAIKKKIKAKAKAKKKAAKKD